MSIAMVSHEERVIALLKKENPLLAQVLRRVASESKPSTSLFKKRRMRRNEKI